MTVDYSKNFGRVVQFDFSLLVEAFKEMGVRVKILGIPTTLTDFPPEQKWSQEMSTASAETLTNASAGTYAMTVPPAAVRREAPFAPTTA